MILEGLLTTTLFVISYEPSATSSYEFFSCLEIMSFFGISRREGLQLATKMAEEEIMNGKPIIFNRGRVDLGPVVLLGCTLQSYVPLGAEQIVTQKVNDFRRIVEWTVKDHNEEHCKDTEWLNNEIKAIQSESKIPDRRIIVIRHHAPSARGTSANSNESNPWSSAFATDLLERADNSPLNEVDLWIFGHTHYSTDSVRGKMRLLSNQRGYVFPNAGSDKKTFRENMMARTKRFQIGVGQERSFFDDQKVVSI